MSLKIKKHNQILALAMILGMGLEFAHPSFAANLTQSKVSQAAVSSLPTDVKSILTVPVNGTDFQLYAMSPTQGVYLSNDAGKNFSLIATAINKPYAFTAFNGNVYVLMEDGLYLFKNGVAKWLAPLPTNINPGTPVTLVASPLGGSAQAVLWFCAGDNLFYLPPTASHFFSTPWSFSITAIASLGGDSTGGLGSIVLADAKTNLLYTLTPDNTPPVAIAQTQGFSRVNFIQADNAGHLFFYGYPPSTVSGSSATPGVYALISSTQKVLGPVLVTHPVYGLAIDPIGGIYVGADNGIYRVDLYGPSQNPTELALGLYASSTTLSPQGPTLSSQPVINIQAVCTSTQCTTDPVKASQQVFTLTQNAQDQTTSLWQVGNLQVFPIIPPVTDPKNPPYPILPDAAWASFPPQEPQLSTMISRDLAVTYVAQNSSDNPLSYNNSVGSYVNTGSLVSSSPVESDLLNINNNNHLWTDLASPAQVQTQPPGFPAGGGQNVYSFMVTSLLASQPIYFSNDQLGFLFSNATPPETNPLETLPVGDYNNQPYGLTSGTPSASSLGPAVDPGVYLPFQNQFSDGGGGSGNGPYSLNYNYVSNPMTADFYGNLYALGQAGVYEYNSGASVNHSTLTSTSTSWSLVAPLTSKNANPQLLSDLMLSYSSTASPAFGKAQAAYSLAVDTMGNIDLLTYNNHLYQYSKSTGAWVSMAQPNPIPTNICGAINLHGLPGNCSNFPNVNLVADSSGDVFYLANFGPNQPVTGAVYEYLAGEAAGTAPVLISTGLPPASDYLGQNYPGFLVGNDGNIYLQASSEVRDPNNPNINGIYELDTNTNPAQWVQVSSNFLYVPINGVAYSFNLYSPSELAIDSAGSFYGLLFSFNTQTVQVVVTRALIAPTALKNK